MCQKCKIDSYVLSIAEPVAVDDLIDTQTWNRPERLNKASVDMAENYKAVIEEEKLGRSSQDSESKQLKKTLCKVIKSCKLSPNQQRCIYRTWWRNSN